MRNPTQFLIALFFLSFIANANSQHSLAREWNEILLENIRDDSARPTVHSRNLYHVSAAMYDCWSAYNENSEFAFLGKTHRGFEFPYNGVQIPADVKAAQEEAISYAVFRLMTHRFEFAPRSFDINLRLNAKMQSMGYDTAVHSINYDVDGPAALGNYLASKIIEFGLQDNANEEGFYNNTFYQPSNPGLAVKLPGNPDMVDPNRWQPLTLDLSIAQNGDTLPFNTPPFLGPEWGNVVPFALSTNDLEVKQRDNQDYWVYHDPGPPPYLEADGSGTSDLYKWGFSLVSVWSSHHDPDDDTLIDISPASVGNIDSYPMALENYDQFYDLLNGGDPSQGHALNPSTGMPYTPQMIKRSDMSRVLAEFWADGPDSETPPGHWFTILNYVNDHPQFEKKYRGQGPVLDELEWDVKAYLLLGGSMHDCAVTAWGLKGYYDYVRPISAIRYMAERGQSSDSSLPNYSPEGFPLIPGYIELIEAGDPLAMADPNNIDEIKVFAWKGPDYINQAATDVAGVDWILAREWWPYQRPTFVSPNFAGYLSGHSTFSSAAAEVLELVTGDAFFPGGMGEFLAEQNEFLVFEDGPSEDVTLQWATYKDASEQTSLSRIWGGIHPPADDLRGRLIGTQIAQDAMVYAEEIFFVDADDDGFFYFEDCDDLNANINPSIPETCNGIDDDCQGGIDDGLDQFTYYLDSDSDGYGDLATALDTCLAIPPAGYVNNSLDCSDSDASINPDVAEVCDGIDNNCSGAIDDDIPYFSFYRDADSDGYGDAMEEIVICEPVPQAGYVIDDTDCDDSNALIFPGATEIPDNGIDEDCNGVDFYKTTKLYPNPTTGDVTIHFETLRDTERIEIYSIDGKLSRAFDITMNNNQGFFKIDDFSRGVYYVRIYDENNKDVLMQRLLKI